MTNYRNAIAALVLGVVFSTRAFAGEGIMHTDKTPPPPPPSQAVGVLWTETAEPALEEDTLTEITFSLLQTLIPLL